MNLTSHLLGLALMGAEWVLWLLVGLSIISLAVIVERIIFYYRHQDDLEALTDEVRRLVASGKPDEARVRLATHRHPAAVVVSAGLKEIARGPEAVAEAMHSAKARARLVMERNLAILGTLGSNAPFIGLFGTVIGIIKAFHDLATSSAKGPAVVMGSLSEALVATAVGLLVAIPAVLAYNYFQRQVRSFMLGTDGMAHSLLVELHATRPAGVQ
ncbi:MAG: MotA/TolQ/ExbB proton channel family protein [Candidatus Riflebacteria bacterium]|nr:MotA/TolQ/ExbB proton channel family protein [Candidatus Riflebacteria bacterium]